MKPSDFYDLDRLKRATGGDEQFMKHMIRIFIDQAPIQLQEMLDASEQKDWKALGATSHKIKSSMRSMGIFSLEDEALALEQDGKYEKNLETIPDRLALFQAKLIQVIEFLSQEL